MNDELRNILISLQFKIYLKFIHDTSYCGFGILTYGAVIFNNSFHSSNFPNFPNGIERKLVKLYFLWLNEIPEVVTVKVTITTRKAGPIQLVLGHYLLIRTFCGDKTAPTASSFKTLTKLYRTSVDVFLVAF